MEFVSILTVSFLFSFLRDFYTLFICMYYLFVFNRFGGFFAFNMYVMCVNTIKIINYQIYFCCFIYFFAAPL